MTTPAHEPALTEILARVRSGEKVIVTEGSGDALVGEVCVAGELTTPDDVGFMAVHARGLVCLAVPVATLQRLEIPLITPDRSAGDGIAYGTSFEATEGVTTGISAADRARSIQVAVDQTSGPRDVVMPGHVPPIRVAAGGV